MKSNFVLRGLFIFLMVGLLSSCSKNEDDFSTPGEINAQKIQSIIIQEQPSEVYVYEFQWDDRLKEYDWDFKIRSSDYEVNGAFIRVEEYYFNLEKLHSFRMDDSYLRIYLNRE